MPKHTYYVIIVALFLVFEAGTPQVAAEELKGLSGALRAVMAYHPAVSGKNEEVRASEGQIKEAEAGRLPSLTTSASVTERNRQLALLRLRQPLWAFGKIDTAIDHAEAQNRTEQFRLLQVQRTLMEETALAYSQIRRLISLGDIAKEDVAAHEKLFKRIETRAKGLVASNADVHLAWSRLVNARVNYEMLSGQLAAARVSFLSLTQKPVDTSEEIAAESYAEADRNALRQDAEANSADIRLKRAQLDTARLQLRQTRLADAPTLYLQYDQHLLDTPSSGRRGEGSLVIEGQLDGFGFATRGRLSRARYQEMAARYDLAQSRNQLKQNLDTLIVNQDLHLKLTHARKEALTAVEKTMASFIRQYDTGRKSWVEVLNTLRDLTAQKTQWVHSRYNWTDATLRIAVLTGAMDADAGIEIP